MTGNSKIFVLAAAVALWASGAFGKVQWQQMESSWLERVGYDRETGTLVVRMQNSSDVYEYRNVPEEVFKGLLEAKSKGAYFATTIQDRYETLRR